MMLGYFCRPPSSAFSIARRQRQSNPLLHKCRRSTITSTRGTISDAARGGGVANHPAVFQWTTRLPTTTSFHRCSFFSFNRYFFNNHHATNRHSYFSTTSASEEETAPFDRRLKHKQRTRAAEKTRQYYYYHLKTENSANNNSKSRRKRPRIVVPYDYFHREVASRLVERLDDIRLHEQGFPLALEIGATANLVHDAIVEGCDDYDDIITNDLWKPEDDDDDDDDNNETENNVHVGGRGGIRKLVQMDSCSAMLHRDDVLAEYDERSDDSYGNPKGNNGIVGNTSVVCETYKLVRDFDGGSSDNGGSNPLPFPDATFDLAISSMAFHWVNNLPKLLSEIERVLKPDGCLLFALPGGNTLPELRSSLVLSELERTGGVSTHVGPYVDLSNIGSLLTGTGFRLPTIDIDEIQIGYPNAMVLMEHLGRMGEGNACTNRKERVGLGTFLGAACLYRELYPMRGEREETGSCDGNEEDGIVASAQVIYGIAWKEHSSQQKPEVRGSATHKLTDIAITKTSIDRD